MSSGREQESVLPEIATSESADAREIRELKVMNDILIGKVIELEDLVDELRKSGRRNLEDLRDGSSALEPEAATLSESEEAEDRQQVDCAIVEEPEPGIHVSSPPPSEVPTTIFKATRSPITPLPDYSPHLPPFDRTIKGEDFYADLQDKRIIPGYDEDRVSCWCHVAKSAQNSNTEVLSISHRDATKTKADKERRYYPSRWFSHASRCPFYKNPWATTKSDGTGQRKFPQFPLQESIHQGEDSGHDHDAESAAADVPRGEKRRRISDSERGLAMTNNVDQLQNDLEQSRCIQNKVSGDKGIQDAMSTGEAMDEDIPEVSNPLEQSRRIGNMTVGYERIQDETSTAEAKFAKIPLQPALGLRRRGESALASNSQAPASVLGSLPTPASSSIPVTTTRPLPNPFRQTTPLPDYSPHLPPIDRTKKGQSFYEDLLAKQLIRSLDDKRWTCWCHAHKKDQIPAPRVLSLSHHKMPSNRAPQHYMAFSWFAHAAICRFYKNPWATEREDGTGGRLFPDFPLPKPPTVTEGTRGTRMEMPRVLERVHPMNDDEDQASESGGCEQKTWGENLFWWY